MNSQSLALNINKNDNFVTIWLKLAIASLIAAGFFSILLVFSRTPVIQNIIPWLDFFHTALVVHVNLSVLIWFMSFAGLFWSIYAQGKFITIERLALSCAIIGTALIIISPFNSSAKPLINNYIPVLQHPLFLTGIAIFSTGLLLQTLRVLILFPGKDSNIFQVAAYVAAIFSASSAIAFFFSWLGIPQGLEATNYYEFLFWGSGHILQYTHTTFLLFSWLLIINYTGGHIQADNKHIRWLFTLLLLPLIYVFYIYSNFEIVTTEHHHAFTNFMKYGGLVSLPLGIISMWYLLQTNKVPAVAETSAAKAALLASITLFATGGIIGFLIHGINVVIPAHYHGSIVGVTLAFMGVTYYLLPRLGYIKPTWKSAQVQPYIYGGGQLMHIIGLAWSGGYGVQRKTAGAAQNLDNLPEIAGMALMGFGGLISIIGGVLFLIVVIRSMWPSNTATSNNQF